MSGAAVEFQSKKIDLFLLNLEKGRKRPLSEAVARTTIFGLKKTKETLPKRSGNLRQSYMQKKNSELEREIFSRLPYARRIEFGGRRKPVTPKRAKVLTIPIKDTALTKSKSQIKKGKLDTLFRRLGKAKPKRRLAVMKSVGIILAKAAKAAWIKPQKNIEREVKPAVQGRLGREVQLVFKKFGFK